ncbi:MAG: lysophospholipid acyltransferase family protein [Phycisphaerales bacterium]|jgi:1-acyl-sn-glycerol-3-phosphate acyltransferase
MQEPQLIPGSFSPRFAAFFSRYVRWRTRRCFHAVRISQPQVLRAFEDDPTPLIVMMNHPGWWDPLTAVLVQQALLRGRPGMAPMDQTQLEKFRFFRHLGLFGIDPDESKNKTAMLNYVHREWAKSPRTVLWITPQGRFADVRAPLELRPGAAVIAARTPGVRVVSLSIEYSFWLDQRPEMFLRLARVAAPERPSIPHWHRALKVGMAENAAGLAELVIGRDPGAFESLLESRAGINPAMNLLLKLRGKSPDIDSARLNQPPRAKGAMR